VIAARSSLTCHIRSSTPWGTPAYHGLSLLGPARSFCSGHGSPMTALCPGNFHARRMSGRAPLDARISTFWNPPVLASGRYWWASMGGLPAACSEHNKQPCHWPTAGRDHLVFGPHWEGRQQRVSAPTNRSNPPMSCSRPRITGASAAGILEVGFDPCKTLVMRPHTPGDVSREIIRPLDEPRISQSGNQGRS
jgi:hypothetical protein